MESMNYIAAPTWYFNQGNELCFQTTIPHHTNIIQDMLTVHPHMLVDCTREPSTLEPKRPALGRSAAAKATSDDEDHRCSKKRKIMHRDVERQRRKEMSTLHALLRSLLPDDFLKGKKSISDHMNEAANYIKHQQKKIQELTEKRDLLQRRVILSPSNSKSSHCHEGIFSSSPLVEVRTTFVGAAVVIVCQPGHEVPLSRVISSLIEEGLNVISVSTSKNAQWVYSLECESDDPGGVDSSGLQQKLMGSICLSN